MMWIPNLVFLPKLKVLSMCLRQLVDDSVQMLIRGCPVLGNLSLHIQCLNEGHEGSKLELDFLAPQSICCLFNTWEQSVRYLWSQIT